MSIAVSLCVIRIELGDNSNVESSVTDSGGQIVSHLLGLCFVIVLVRHISSFWSNSVARVFNCTLKFISRCAYCVPFILEVLCPFFYDLIMFI